MILTKSFIYKKKLGFTIFATEDTAKALRENGLFAVQLYKTMVEEKFRTIMEDEFKIRRMAVDFNLLLLSA